jgi:hypothetical protein
MRPGSICRGLGAALRLAVVLAVAVAAPRSARAEAVECPTCWRLIDDGPCRCPHDNTPLPGRTCPPEGDAQAPAAPPGSEPPRSPPSATPDARDGQDSPRRAKRRPVEGGGTKARRRVKRRPGPDVARTAPAGEQTERDATPVARREATVEAGFGEAPPPPDDVGPDDDDVVDDAVVDDDEETNEDEDEDEDGDEERDARRGRRDEPVVDEQRPPQDPYRRGPAFLVGYRYFGVYDWVGEGHSHAFTVEGYPFGQYVSWLRIGLGLDVGFRTAEQHTDWIMNGFVSLGAQYPRRVAPYGNVQIGGGTMYRRRFGQGLTDGLLTVGVNAGATFRLSRTFVADLSIGYLYLFFADLGFHSPNIRVGLGW